MNGIKRAAWAFHPSAEATSPLEGRRMLSAATVTSLPAVGEVQYLDAAGDVVGHYDQPTDRTTPVTSYFFLPRGGKPVPIGFLPGDSANLVLAVNPSGLVAGISSSAPSPSLLGRGFLYSQKAGLAPIPTLPGFTDSEPTALSDGGLVAGVDIKLLPSGSDPSSNPDPDTPGFVYGKRLGLIGLGTLPGFPILAPTAVNDAAGLVVGNTWVPDGPSATTLSTSHAFAFSLATRKAVDLGTLPGFDSSDAKFLNAQGMIAGALYNSGNPYVQDVFVYTRSTGMRDIGHLPGFDQSSPVSLGGDGRLFLQVTSSTTGVSDAAEYTIRGGLKDLGTLPAPEADGLNATPTLTPPNAHGRALVVTSNWGGVPSPIYLDDLNTGRLIDLDGVLGPGVTYDLLGDSPGLNNAGEFLASTYNNFNNTSQTYLIKLNPKGFPPARSDLSVAVTGLPASVRPGQVVTATVTVTNAGPDLATGSTLAVGLGPGWTLASATGPGWPGRSSVGYVNHLGPLVNGGSVKLTLRLRANSSGAGTVTATVANRTDPVPANNKVTATSRFA